MTGKAPGKSTQEDEPHEPLATASEAFSGVEDERIFTELRGQIFRENTDLRVGRYRILRQLGAGAMGEVQLAMDDELERPIAVKFVHPHLASQRGAEALRQEARALARLAHPNVVHVYEVGAHQDRVYLAMEYIEGTSVREWIRDESPGWDSVLAAYVDAARGLAAAHGAGVVHCDFKPDNVLRGVDGRVAVADFGLAALDRPDPDPDPDPDRDLRATMSSGAEPRSHTTRLKGTPAYMPPEQFEGSSDARSDQFSLCVSVYEGLWGRRPFRRQSLAAMLAGGADWTPLAPPRRSGVPAWPWPILRRGLARDPEQRWPSIDELIAALEHGVLRRRRLSRGVATLAIGACSAALGGAAWGTFHAPAQPPPAQLCRGMEAKLAGVWDEGARAEVERALLATELGYAPQTWTRVAHELDAYAGDWVAARQDACEATVRGEQSAELLDLRMACFDERLTHLRAAVGVLQRADPDLVKKAVSTVLGLPALARCADLEALTSEVAPPEDPALARRVIELDEQLIEAHAYQRAGKYDEALTLARGVIEELDAIDYEPLKARAWLREGSLQERVDKPELAIETLERAYDAAVAQGMDAEAAKAANSLVFVTSDRMGQLELARTWTKVADPLSRVLGTDRARTSYLGQLARLELKEGNYPRARELNEDVLARKQEALGPTHLDLAQPLNSLGLIARRVGDEELAQSYFERSLEVYEDAVGPEHPFVAYVLGNLGLLSAGDTARAYHERALAIREATLPPGHTDIAASLSNLGIVARASGDYAEARRLYERALAILELAHGPEHPALISACINLGNLAMAEGDHEGGLVYLERALAVIGQTLGLDSPDALLIELQLGQSRLELGEPSTALEHLEHALRIYEAHEGGDEVLLAMTHFGLARALWDAPRGEGRDRTRALRLAREAHTFLSEAVPDSVEVIEGLPAVTAWLAAHGG